MSRKSKKPGGPSSTLGRTRLVAFAAATIAMSALTGGLPVVARTQAGDDPTEIHERVAEYQAAWNTHDSSALAPFFAEDADFAMGNLPDVRGRAQIRDWWQDYFARQEPERRLTLEVNSLRLIAADVAVVNVATTTGGNDRDGRELPERSFRGTWLLERSGGNWLIQAMRGVPSEEDRVVLNASLEAAEALRPQIRGLVAAYEDALTAQNPSAVSELYAGDAEIIIRNAPPVRGGEAIRNWWRTYFSEPRPYRPILIIDEIRTIAPDVALINITATGDVPQPEGQTLPVRYARATWVVVREAGEWLISALWILPSEDDQIVRREPAVPFD